MDPLHAQSPMLENVLNFRDVAETINALAGKSILQDGLLFRSARVSPIGIGTRAKLTGLVA